MPVEMGTFWASSSKKVKLQNMMENFIIKHIDDKMRSIETVLSGTGIEGESETTPCQIISVDDPNITSSLPDLDKDIEEADVRLIPHTLHGVTSVSSRVVILSNDTDVLVLSVHFWNLLHSHGLIELWMRGGVGDTTRYIPVHKLATNIGPAMCRVLPAVHQLTGCDSTIKFGTKYSGLKVHPELYLGEFGKDPDDIDLEKVEEYLVQVMKPGLPSKTMDE